NAFLPHSSSHRKPIRAFRVPPNSLPLLSARRNMPRNVSIPPLSFRGVMFSAGFFLPFRSSSSGLFFSLSSPRHLPFVWNVFFNLGAPPPHFPPPLLILIRKTSRSLKAIRSRSKSPSLQPALPQRHPVAWIAQPLPTAMPRGMPTKISQAIWNAP